MVKKKDLEELDPGAIDPGSLPQEPADPEIAGQWKNRIIGSGLMNPDDFLANPKNFRLHPKNQQLAVKGILEEVGIVQQVIVNQRTGFLVDGHLRAQLALKTHQKSLPVLFVDLSDDEEEKILATLDASAAAAQADREKLKEIVEAVEGKTENEDIKLLLSEMSAREGIFDDSILEDAFRNFLRNNRGNFVVSCVFNEQDNALFMQKWNKRLGADKAVEILKGSSLLSEEENA